MAYTAIHFHCVFSTKERRKFLDPELLNRVSRYITGIVTNIRGKMLWVNGTTDHLHILLGLPPNVHVAEAMMKVKANSSKWIHETLPNLRQFAWQESYGAFVVEPQNLGRIIQYIKGQEEHHKKQTFEDEFIELLKQHGIDFDPLTVFG